jgi:hypothetical protein
MTDQKISRRQLLQTALVGFAAVPAATLIARDAGAAEALSESDPQAKSLGYVTDASKVVAATNPTFKPGQHCGNCFQFKPAKAGAAEGACAIFAGKIVKSTGWCKVWVPAAAAQPG